MEIIEKRLTELYRSRATTERDFVVSLRYKTDDVFINDNVNSLTELRGRIQELERLLDYTVVNKIKKTLGIDLQ